MSYPFKDKQTVSKWARSAVAEASNLKLMAGYPDGTFKGQDVVTREQLAAVSVRQLHETMTYIDAKVSELRTELMKALKHEDTKKEKIIRDNKPAIAKIKAKKGWGSGSVISASGQIITNWHVIESSIPDGQVSVYLMSDEKESKKHYDASIVNYDKGKDLALLQITAADQFPHVVLANELPEEGADILVMGYPLAMYNVVSTQGMLSQDKQMADLKFLMQTDSAVNPGNSGGAMFGEDSKQIAVTVATIREHNGMAIEGINFGIPIEKVREFLKDQGIEV